MHIVRLGLSIAKALQNQKCECCTFLALTPIFKNKTQNIIVFTCVLILYILNDILHDNHDALRTRGGRTLNVRTLMCSKCNCTITIKYPKKSFLSLLSGCQSRGKKAVKLYQRMCCSRYSKPAYTYMGCE